MNIAAALPVHLPVPNVGPVNKRGLLLRLVRAAQPISRTDIAERLSIDRSTVTENVKPLIDSGIIREDVLTERINGRRPRVLSFAGDDDYFIGINLGVRHSQIGVTTLNGEFTDEDEYETPKDAATALKITRRRIESLVASNSGRRLRAVGVSVPGMTDAGEQLCSGPHTCCRWRLDGAVKVSTACVSRWRTCQNRER